MTQMRSEQGVCMEHIGQRMETTVRHDEDEAAPHPILACALLAAAHIAPSFRS